MLGRRPCVPSRKMRVAATVQKGREGPERDLSLISCPWRLRHTLTLWETAGEYGAGSATQETRVAAARVTDAEGALRKIRKQKPPLKWL